MSGNAFGPVSGRLKGAERFAFVTGAGISQESGIATFRGPGGYWRGLDPMKMATAEAFRQDPGLVWEWYRDRRRNVLTASPNRGHESIAALEERRRVAVLTQNIDGLHQRAGSSRVIELHGSIVRTRCSECSAADRDGANQEGRIPRCGCGGLLRPDVVWFGEPLPPVAWERAVAEAISCDVMVIVGTSLVVSPANTLPLYARRGGAMLIEINPQETAASAEADLSVRDTAASALPELLAAVRD